MRLARWMGSSPKQIYDLRVAEERIGNEIRNTIQPVTVQNCGGGEDVVCLSTQDDGHIASRPHRIETFKRRVRNSPPQT